MHAHEAARRVCQRLDVRPQLLGPQRAVEPRDERLRVCDRDPERFGRLTRQRPAAGVRDRAGHHHWKAHPRALELGFDRVYRGLGVEGIEHRLDHDQIDAAGQKTPHSLGIGLDERHERHVSSARIVHVGRQAGGSVGRSEHPRNETRAPGRRVVVRTGAGEPGGTEVHLFADGFQPVVALRNPGRAEGIRLDDVRAGRQVRAVDVPDDIRTGQRQQVVVAAQRMAVVHEAVTAIVRLCETMPLHHRAHCPVDHEDASFQGTGEGCRGHGRVFRVRN